LSVLDFLSASKKKDEKKKKEPKSLPFLPLLSNELLKTAKRSPKTSLHLFKIFLSSILGAVAREMVIFSNEEKKISEERFLLSVSKEFSCARSPTLNRC